MYNIKLKVKSLNKKINNQYKSFLINFLKLQKIQFSYFNLPTKRKRITLLKSSHVYKKARDQFELKTYNSILNIKVEYSKLKTLKNILLNKSKLITTKIKINN